jgi:hypothetical protein
VKLETCKIDDNWSSRVHVIFSTSVIEHNELSVVCTLSFFRHRFIDFEHCGMRNHMLGCSRIYNPGHQR